MLDNLSAHKAPEVTDWLAEPEQSPLAPALHAHELEWLNLVERWFGLLTDRRLRRGVFGSVNELIKAIRPLGQPLERRPEALHLAKAADEIIEKVQRGRAKLHQIKSATDH